MKKILIVFFVCFNFSFGQLKNDELFKVNDSIVSVDEFGGIAPILLPLAIAGFGLIFSIVGSLFVRIKTEDGSVQSALNLGNWLSVILTVFIS